jgi:hypothetical protein
MKTIEHKGKVYLIDAVYEFSDDGKDWYVDTLEAIHPESNYPYRTGLGHGYNSIRACQAKVGAIEDTPAELIDGECYQFTAHLVNERKGFFLAEFGRLYCTTGAIVDPSKCTNIKHLVVGG